MLQRLSHHILNLRHQFGYPLKLGTKDYKLRGYIANRLGGAGIQHEATLRPLIKEALESRPGQFVDVGANVGQTLLKVLEVDQEREYFGFEPQLACCHLIETFINDNDLRGCHVLPIALSESDQIAEFYSDAAFDEMASLVRGSHGRAHQGVEYVQTRNGDTLLSELNIDDPAIIKIDVEGAELQVLRGLKKTITKSKPTLFFEVMPNFTGEERTFLPDDVCKNQRLAAEEIWAMLAANGYNVFNIDEDGKLFEISHFELDDPTGYKGYNFMAKSTRS